jgi:threonine aldolase
MNLGSDNLAGVSPEMIAAISRVNEGTVAAYGADDVTAGLTPLFANFFEHDVAVFPLTTGTAANSLALAALVPPYGSVYCHQVAHIANDECNAPEFYTGGAKLVLMEGANGKLNPDALAAAIDAATPHNEHNAQPAAVCLSQITEVGTTYTPDQVAELAEIAHARGLQVHMDGARIANAVVHLGCSFADISWRAGVDALSFGATKNGALAAEALVFFDPAKGTAMPFLRKRAGHLISKMRFVSAQLEAYFTNDLWQTNALHANSIATKIAAGLGKIENVDVLYPVEGNQIFARLAEGTFDKMAASGHGMGHWDEADRVVRMVAAFNSDVGEIEGFLADMKVASGA